MQLVQMILPHQLIMQNNIFIENVDKYRDESLFEETMRIIPQERTQKVLSCRLPEAKLLSLGAGKVLADALQSQGIRSRDVHFLYGVNGKPYLADYPDFHFSITHSGTMVMCVIDDREVGCDIEKITERDNRKLAKRFFTEYEYESIYSIENIDEQRAMFYRIWTLKESFLKMTGTGITISLDSFGFRWNQDKTISLLYPDHDVDCYFEEIALEGYRAAICYKNE